MNKRQLQKIDGIVCFGDSILAGIGASDRQYGCSKLIKSALSVLVSLKGKNRDTSLMALQRVEQDVLSQKYCSHVLIMFGNNDGWPDKKNQPLVSPAEFEANIKAIVRKVSENEQTPILLNLQPLDSENFFASFPEYLKKKDHVSLGPVEWQKQYSDRLLKIAQDLEVGFIDIRSVLERNIDGMIGSDGLHPTDLGHKSIASTIITYLSNVDPSIMAGERYK